ncbi:hypothetical protein T265_00512 [Opisthorchis viverrini]|uniref:Uncharacterized protein n=1 Tax=Opisthorchis viverrini TaxID=6198 RepID=A0A075A2P3_OPIVI|nr:hypothetical protein T265_00512 [Opisthorchis viverrini]KER33621.1 hypothetical protein T265_00512 [Opisthorchis viverrini]
MQPPDNLWLPSAQSVFSLTCDYFNKYTQLRINLVFTGDSVEPLVFMIFFNRMCCTQVASCFSWFDIRDITVYFHEGSDSQGCWKLFDSPQPVSPSCLGFISLTSTGDSIESLIYDVLQLNVLHTGRLMFQLVRYSRYRSIFSQRKLLKWFLTSTGDSIESLIYDVLQLNVLHTGRLMFQLVRYSRYRSIFSQRKLLKWLWAVEESSAT